RSSPSRSRPATRHHDERLKIAFGGREIRMTELAATHARLTRRHAAGTSGDRASVRARALMAEATEHLAEVVRVRKTALLGDTFERQARRDEQARRRLHAHFGHEARRREAGTSAKVVAERRAAQTSFASEHVDGEMLSEIAEHPRAELLEHALGVGLLHDVREPLVGVREGEELLLDGETIAKILEKCAANEAHETRDELAVRRRRDDGPRHRDLPRDATQNVRVIDADPRERPAG